MSWIVVGPTQHDTKIQIHSSLLPSPVLQKELGEGSVEMIVGILSGVSWGSIPPAGKILDAFDLKPPAPAFVHPRSQQP